MKTRLKIGFALLGIVALSLAPGVMALPSYLSAYDSVYSGGSCGTCHVSPGGGGALNSYGNKFAGQSNYAADPVTALKTIGSATGQMSTPTPTPTETQVEVTIPAEETITSNTTETLTSTIPETVPNTSEKSTITVNGEETKTVTSIPEAVPNTSEKSTITVNGEETKTVTIEDRADTDRSETDGAEIEGKVFNDKNKDKNLDNGENGIANMPVKLTGTGKDTKGIHMRTKTDKNGNYKFTGLKPGRYVVHSKHKDGWKATTRVTKIFKNLKKGEVVKANFGKEKVNKE